jgi:hypothetical protein
MSQCRAVSVLLISCLDSSVNDCTADREMNDLYVITNNESVYNMDASRLQDIFLFIFILPFLKECILRYSS